MKALCWEGVGGLKVRDAYDRVKQAARLQTDRPTAVRQAESVDQTHLGQAIPL